MSAALVREHVDVDAPPERVWDLLVDWPRQSEWIPLTRVRGDAGASAIGATIEAWTGLGPVGFLDTMTITAWDPPRRCEVLHTGRVVRGEGGFVVTAHGAARARCEWWERLDLPGGALGRAVWPLVRPLAGRGVRRALLALKADAES